MVSRAGPVGHRRAGGPARRRRRPRRSPSRVAGRTPALRPARPAGRAVELDSADGRGQRAGHDGPTARAGRMPALRGWVGGRTTDGPVGGVRGGTEVPIRRKRIPRRLSCIRPQALVKAFVGLTEPISSRFGLVRRRRGDCQSHRSLDLDRLGPMLSLHSGPMRCGGTAPGNAASRLMEQRTHRLGCLRPQHNAAHEHELAL
jgi:hypothetical protein